MCDCYDEEFEDLAMETKEQEPVPQLVPLQIAKRKK